MKSTPAVVSIEVPEASDAKPRSLSERCGNAAHPVDGGAIRRESSERLALLPGITFALQLREMRRKIWSKQSCFARVVRCTEAAVSYWESGRRLPQPSTLERIIRALGSAGVSQLELFELRNLWEMVMVIRAGGQE